jgi:hypothetical protein
VLLFLVPGVLLFRFSVSYSDVVNSDVCDSVSLQFLYSEDFSFFTVSLLVLMAWNVACDLRQLFWIFSIIYDLGEVVRLVFAFSHEQEEFYYNAVIILPLRLPCSYYLIIFLYSFPSLFAPLHVHIQICVTYDQPGAVFWTFFC